jgi:hypothetical protein
MQRRAIVVGGRKEGLAVGKADKILAAMVVSSAVALHEFRAGRRDQRFGGGRFLALRNPHDWGEHVRGQAFALLDIEYNEAFQERHGVGFVASLARPFLLALGKEAVGVADGGAALALADMPPKAQGLAEGKPFLRSETAPNDGIPQYQDIDTRIEFPARGAAGQAKRCAGREPRLNPRHATLFQFAHDAVGYFVIEGYTARAAGWLLVGLAHKGPPAPISRAQFPGSGVGGVFDRRGPPSEAGRTRRAGAKRRTRVCALRHAAAGLEGSAARTAEGIAFKQCRRAAARRP